MLPDSSSLSSGHAVECVIITDEHLFPTRGWLDGDNSGVIVRSIHFGIGNTEKVDAGDLEVNNHSLVESERIGLEDSYQFDRQWPVTFVQCEEALLIVSRMSVEGSLDALMP